MYNTITITAEDLQKVLPTYEHGDLKISISYDHNYNVALRSVQVGNSTLDPQLFKTSLRPEIVQLVEARAAEHMNQLKISETAAAEAKQKAIDQKNAEHRATLKHAWATINSEKVLNRSTYVNRVFWTDHRSGIVTTAALNDEDGVAWLRRSCYDTDSYTLGRVWNVEGSHRRVVPIAGKAVEAALKLAVSSLCVSFWKTSKEDSATRRDEDLLDALRASYPDRMRQMPRYSFSRDDDTELAFVLSEGDVRDPGAKDFSHVGGVLRLNHLSFRELPIDLALKLIEVARAHGHKV